MSGIFKNTREYFLWSKFYSVPDADGLDWQALRTIDPAKADRQVHRMRHSPLIPRGDADATPDQHVMLATALERSFAGVVRLEKELQFALEISVRHKFWANLLFQLLSQRKPDAQPSDLAASCPWFRTQVGTEDFWEGHRQNHVSAPSCQRHHFWSPNLAKACLCSDVWHAIRLISSCQSVQPRTAAAHCSLQTSSGSGGRSCQRQHMTLFSLIYAMFCQT